MLIADMKANKKLKPIVPEFFIRNRKLIISLVFDIITLFESAKRDTLFYQENTKNKELNK